MRGLNAQSARKDITWTLCNGQYMLFSWTRIEKYPILLIHAQLFLSQFCDRLQESRVLLRNTSILYLIVRRYDQVGQIQVPLWRM